MWPPCGGRTPTPAAPDPATQASTTPGHCRAARGRKPQARVPARRRPHELVAPAVSIPRGPLLRRPDRRAAGNKGAAAAAPPASPRTPPQPLGPARPHRSPSPRADCPRPLDGRPGRAGASGALQGRLGPHSPLQHQDDGEPLGNLAESGAMQTLELRCGHSIATRRAARRTEAPRPGGEGGEGRRRDSEGSAWGRSSPGALPTAAASRALASKKAKASGRRVFPPAVSRSPAPENVVLRHPGSAATPRLEASVFPGRPLPSPGQAPPTGPAPPPSSPAGWGPRARRLVAQRRTALGSDFPNSAVPDSRGFPRPRVGWGAKPGHAGPVRGFYPGPASAHSQRRLTLRSVWWPDYTAVENLATQESVKKKIKTTRADRQPPFYTRRHKLRGVKGLAPGGPAGCIGPRAVLV